MAGEDAELIAVSARWVAGAVGDPDGTATPGARLLIWDEGRWKEGPANSAALTAPVEVAWSTSTDADWAALDPITRATTRIAEIDRSVVVPAGTTDSGAGTIGGVPASNFAGSSPGSNPSSVTR